MAIKKKSGKVEVEEKGRAAANGDVPPVEDDLFVLLDRIQPDAGDKPDDFLAKLSQKIADEDGARGQALVVANLHRVRIGLELLSERDKGLPAGESMADWQERRAKALGMKARNLRYIISAAEEIAEARTLAKILPIRVLARGLTRIPRTVMTFVSTGKFATPPAALTQSQRRGKLLAQFARLGDRAERFGESEWFWANVRSWVPGPLVQNPPAHAPKPKSKSPSSPRPVPKTVKANTGPKKTGAKPAAPDGLHEGMTIRLLAGKNKGCTAVLGRFEPKFGNAVKQITNAKGQRVRSRSGESAKTWVRPDQRGKTWEVVA